MKCRMEPTKKEPLYIWAHRMAREGHAAFGPCAPCKAAGKFLRDRKARRIKEKE